MFSAGLIALTLYKVPATIKLSTPVPAATATATPIKLIKLNNTIKNIQVVALKYTNKRGELNNATVSAKDTTSITVSTTDGNTIKVDIGANTQFRRRFWGKSTLAEITVGDNVDVIGRWVSEDRNEVKAVLIRDNSIQKRNGVFFGNVKSITDTGFVMTTIHRGEKTVAFDTVTKIIGRDEKPISQNDIKVGDVVRVRGLWDSAKFTISEVAQIKDFNLPLQATPEAENK